MLPDCTPGSVGGHQNQAALMRCRPKIISGDRDG